MPSLAGHFIDSKTENSLQPFLARNTGAGARDFYLDDVVVKDISPARAYSVRLNGSANEKYGLARSLEVEVGDVVNMEVLCQVLGAGVVELVGRACDLDGANQTSFAGASA